MFKKTKESGFSLVEMLVVVVIFALLSLVVLLEGASFNNSILLESLSYEMALAVRQAQVYGLSVRSDLSGSSGQFDVAHGVRFDVGEPKSFFLFVDKGKDGNFDEGTDEKLETFTISGSNFIESICLTAGTTECFDSSNPGGVDVTYSRPDPEAVIKKPSGAGPYTSAEITVSTPQESKRKIVLTNTGQISVEETN